MRSIKDEQREPGGVASQHPCGSAEEVLRSIDDLSTLKVTEDGWIAREERPHLHPFTGEGRRERPRHICKAACLDEREDLGRD
jgi:hypothetical protein